MTRKSKISKIQESVNFIKEQLDEPGIIILNPKTYKNLHKENLLIFGPHFNYPYNSILGIPFIVENIKEDCLVLSKSTLEMIKNKLE